MVSGFVTSPDDQSRICLLDASPIRMASKSLMSITCAYASFLLLLCSSRSAPSVAFVWWVCAADPLVFDLYVGHLVDELADLDRRLFFLFFLLDRQLLVEDFVGREGQLA